MIFAVYGTLRKGDYNSYRLAGKEPISTELIHGFDMYDLGGYPYIVRGSGEVLFELYECSWTEMASTISMELGAGYQIDEVDTSMGKAAIFLYTDTARQRQLEWAGKDNRRENVKIVGGDWLTYTNQKMEREYATD